MSSSDATEGSCAPTSLTFTTANWSTEEQALLNRPISELNLSVRARKCLQKLNLRTLGELTRTTDAELLGCKNFGVTSLNEIKRALSSYGLSLRSLD